MRIASLLASATEIVYALNLGDALGAISHECDYPPEALRHPRVSRPRFDPTGLSSAEIDAAVRDTMARHGSVYELDAERLQELEPDLVLTQAVCEVCAVPTSLAEEASRMLPRKPRVVSIDSHSVDQILHSITAVAEAAGVPDRAADVVAALRRRLGAGCSVGPAYLGAARRVGPRLPARDAVWVWSACGAAGCWQVRGAVGEGGAPRRGCGSSVRRGRLGLLQSVGTAHGGRGGDPRRTTAPGSVPGLRPEWPLGAVAAREKPVSSMVSVGYTRTAV